jgi:hypothetical protein
VSHASTRRFFVITLLVIALLVGACGRKRFVTSISVQPEEVVFGGAAAGATVQYTAVGTFNNDTTEDVTTRVVWSSAPDGIISINANGLGTILINCSLLGDNVASVRATNGPDLDADNIVSGTATVTVERCPTPTP